MSLMKSFPEAKLYKHFATKIKSLGVSYFLAWSRALKFEFFRLPILIDVPLQNMQFYVTKLIFPLIIYHTDFSVNLHSKPVQISELIVQLRIIHFFSIC